MVEAASRELLRCTCMPITCLRYAACGQAEATNTLIAQRPEPCRSLHDLSLPNHSSHSDAAAVEFRGTRSGRKRPYGGSNCPKAKLDVPLNSHAIQTAVGVPFKCAVSFAGEVSTGGRSRPPPSVILG